MTYPIKRGDRLVYLVGAGPGDKELLTLKGKKCLEQADIVIYDHLVNTELLEFCRADCECIYVGKVANQHTLTQEKINALLVSKAKTGKCVVRLKGGDPYVFGRGGEEADYLYQHQIAFEIVPGITSAIGGLCYAGIPITHRDFASSFHVMTGHYKDEQSLSEKINWDALTQLEGTLVFLMGLKHLKEIIAHLVQSGKPLDTPVALISSATLPSQMVVTGTIQTIEEKARDKKLDSPMLIVIGEVVLLRSHLNFYENKPLFGKQIVVTRSREQKSELIDKINSLGGKVLSLPMIEIKKCEPNRLLDQAIECLKSYTYLILTSSNATQLFFDALKKHHDDVRCLAHLKIAAIGKSTAKALEAYGIKADFVPPKADSESLAMTLSKELTFKDKVLLPQSLCAREVLMKQLSLICNVEVIPLYEPVAPCSKELMEQREQFFEALSQDAIDYITFTSSSTVSHFVSYIGKDYLNQLNQIKFISIGPITSKTLKNFGLAVYKEASEPTIQSLVNCLL